MGGSKIAGSSRQRYTLDDVRRSYGADKAWGDLQGDWPSYLIYRPLSIYLTPLCLALRVPILAVTLSSGVISALVLTIAWRGGEYAYVGVAALGFCFHVIDCLDGNMARTTDRTSSLGALLDGTLDMVFWCALFASMGLLVEHAGGGVLGDRALPFALGLAILVLLGRLTRDSYSLYFRDQTYFREEIPDRLSPSDLSMIALVGLEGTYVYAILIGGFFGVLDRVLVGIGVYVALIFVGALAITFSNALGADRAPK